MKAQKKKVNIDTEKKDEIPLNNVNFKDSKFAGEGKRMDGRKVDLAKLQKMQIADKKPVAPLKRLKNGLVNFKKEYLKFFFSILLSDKII